MKENNDLTNRLQGNDDGEDIPFLPTRKDIAFLIEDCDDNKSSSPEVISGVNLAKANDCEFFDAISSFDVTHLSEALKGVNERNQKVLALSVYLFFFGEGSTQNIIDTIIKPPFQRLVEMEQLKAVPKWVSSLNLQTIGTFTQEVFDTYFDGDQKSFVVESRKLIDDLFALSNQISQRQFIQFLKGHPDVTTVYGLVGQLHLIMLDSVGKTIPKNDDHCHIQVNINDRIVDVHLFGGAHGEIAHYNKMAGVVGKAGFVVPDLSTLPKPEIDETAQSLLSVLSTESNPRYSCDQSSSQSTDRDPEYDMGRSEKRVEERSTSDLVDEFYSWIKHFDESHKNSGHYKENDKPLISRTPNFGVENNLSDSELHRLTQAIAKNRSMSDLVDDFDSWMNHYVESHKKHGHYKDNNKALISWLSADFGAECIQSYSEFRSLAEAIATRGYKTNPPPAEEHFLRARKEYQRSTSSLTLVQLLLSVLSTESNLRYSCGGPEYDTGRSEKRVEEQSIIDLVDKFDYWMNHYVEGHQRDGDYTDNNKALISWLTAAKGAQDIQSYSEFCKLAQAIATRGYKTNPPPAETDFQHALEEYELRLTECNKR